MENLLSARFKNLIGWWLTPLIILILGSVSILYHKGEVPLLVQRDLQRNILRTEKEIDGAIQALKKRSDTLYHQFRSKTLNDSQMKKKEALFEVEQGVIRNHIGELYIYKLEPLAIGDWQLIEKNREVYFFRKMAGQIFYINHLFNLERNFILESFTLPHKSKTLTFFSSSHGLDRGIQPFNVTADRYSFQYRFTHLKNHMVLEMIFSPKDMIAHFREQNVIRFLVTTFGILIYFTIFFWRRRRQKKWRLPVFILLSLVLICLSLIADHFLPGNMFLIVVGLTILRVHHILLVCLLILLFFYYYRREISFPPGWPRLILGDLLFLGVFFIADNILEAAQFSFADFRLVGPYPFLLASFILILLMPYLVASGLGRYRQPWRIPLLVLVQAGFSALTWRLFPHYFILILVYLAFTLAAMFIEPRSARRWLVVPLVAYSVSQMFFSSSAIEKRNFIQNDLRQVFSSQNTYAKLVAKEITYELNSQAIPFEEYLFTQRPGDLARAWNNSLAHEELIPSGIFIVSATGETLASSYSYKIPYIKISKDIRFPFWSMEEVTGSLYGKPVNLAVSSLSVMQEGEWLGDIVIEVVISPELILKNLDQTTLFTINQKIRDSGISYLKMIEESQILENPNNIHVPELSGIIRNRQDWIHFSHLGIFYSGFCFDHNENRILIYFPNPTWVQRISTWIKIFLFMLLFQIILFLRPFKEFDWELYLRSFSSRVFTFLILISFTTSILFTAFSLNFHFPELERELLEAVNEKGRIVQNMLRNLLSEKSDLNQNDLFMLSNIVDSPVTVYENGKTPISSDSRKIIEGQIPIFLNSAITRSLEEQARQFYVERFPDGIRLYSKLSETYIFLLEFPMSRFEQKRMKKYYIDFLITLSFFLILIGAIIARFFRNRILAPITGLNRGMEDVRTGNLVPLTDIPKEIELKSLFSGFNSMIDGIREQRENISELARMRTMMQLSRRLAHEIKNPLTPIKLSAEQIQRTLHDKSSDHERMIEQSVRYIVEEVEHLRKVSLGFLDLSKLEKLKINRFDLADLIRQEMTNLCSLFPQIRFRVDLPAEPQWVDLDPVKIKQALINLVNNAVEACEVVLESRLESREDLGGESPARLPITVSLKNLGEMSEIVITDKGIGMKPEELGKLFHEDYSSKETGTGLGLVIVKRIAELHRGNLRISSRSGEGTMVTLTIANHVPQT